jgi:Fic family protein
MNMMLSDLTRKKQSLDQLQPLAPELINNLREWFRVELTYTSNAIEGNTLTRQETALVVEKGLGIEGKTLKEVLEAAGHAKAFDYIEQFAGGSRANITEDTILAVHARILGNIDDVNAGHYRSVPVRIAGSRAVMPNYLKVPDLMADFAAWLKTKNSDHPVKIAADAHFKLVSIHPFVDGNGRTARLLMNLLLMQSGYTSAIIRPEDRSTYITALETAQTGGSLDGYYDCIYTSVDRSLDIYLESVGEPSGGNLGAGASKLLKIGELAKATDETVPTLRHWTREGLLDVVSYTPGGYQLYESTMIGRAKEIRRLQADQRQTLAEIKRRLG